MYFSALRYVSDASVFIKMLEYNDGVTAVIIGCFYIVTVMILSVLHVQTGSGVHPTS
jgi:hypothetical protein